MNAGDVTLVPAGAEMLDYLIEMEARPEVRPWILPWPREKHAVAIADPAYRYFRIDRQDGEPVGFVFLHVVGTVRPSVELIRIAIDPPGEGLGAAVFDRLKSLVLGDWGARRFWLDVFVDNARAQRVYEREGFQREALWRDACLKDGEVKSLMIMGIAPDLQPPEFRALDVGTPA